MEFNKEILKGYIDSILMSLLENEPLYGYELGKRARSTSGGMFELKEATLYVSLKRLEKNESLTSYWGDSDAGGGRRKYYQLTEKGREDLANKKREWSLFKETIDQFLGGKI